jgi:hypothetical protein
MVYNDFMSNCSTIPENFGADPAFVQWKVVRGDTARIRIEFYESDGETYYDISSWTFVSSAYDLKNGGFDTLTVTAGSGYVDITAPANLTATWGTGQTTIVTEMSFDLQVTINSEKWTPVIGKITVLADVSI